VQVEEPIVTADVVVVVVVEHSPASETLLDASNTNRQKKMAEKALRDCPFIIKLFASQVVTGLKNTIVFCRNVNDSIFMGFFFPNNF